MGRGWGGVNHETRSAEATNSPPPCPPPSRGRVIRPMFERALLDLPDQLRGLRALPLPRVAVLSGAADPPALPRQPVGLSHDEHCERRLAALLRLVIDEG